jgi:hypothetical protein
LFPCRPPVYSRFGLIVHYTYLKNNVPAGWTGVGGEPVCKVCLFQKGRFSFTFHRCYGTISEVCKRIFPICFPEGVI